VAFVKVFVTGSTGYMGRRLAAELLKRGHEVTALARSESNSRVPPGCRTVIGDALEAGSYSARVPRECVFVHLVGVARPNPRKAAEFQEVDLSSIRAAVTAAALAGAKHFVYVSVAHPAPVMQAYIEARMQGEALIRSAGLNATILRPWYVLGPGHWWPLALLPTYWLMERIPSTRETARRLGLVTIRQMVRALAAAVEHPAAGLRIVDVPGIRAAGAVAEEER
jgi:uncharacterized protein YbjT (DUF2867 family)